MKLKRLIENLNMIESKNLNLEMDISGISFDSRKVKEGDLYVAIRGYVTDGHSYVPQAMDKGAVLLIVEEFVKSDLPQIRVENSRIALSILSANFYNHPSRNIKVIGVTSTNGKTTTTFILDAIFQKAGYSSGVIGSVINKTGSNIRLADLTTPESYDLQVLFKEMEENQINRVAMEVSSSALELHRTNDIDFDIVSFNNFSREHIDQHGSFERYWEVKSSLIRNAKESSIAVLNLDNDKVATLVNDTRAKVVTFSINTTRGMIQCEDVFLNKGRASFKVNIREDIHLEDRTINKGSFNVSLRIPGYHSVENAMMAIVISLCDGISIEVIKEALTEFGGVERRFEYIYEDDFIVIDDHFANIKNINSTLETIADMEKNKVHIVYAIRGNRGVTVNRENAEALLSWKDKLRLEELVATRSIGSVTDKDKVKESEEAELIKVIGSSELSLIIFDTIKGAVEHTMKKVSKGDIILLAGCQGMDRGAKEVLAYIAKLNPEIDTEKLYYPLKNRISEHLTQL